MTTTNDKPKTESIEINGDCAFYIGSHMPIDLQYKRMSRFIEAVVTPFTCGDIIIQNSRQSQIAAVYTELLHPKGISNTPIEQLKEDYARGQFAYVIIDMPVTTLEGKVPDVIQELSENRIPHINIQREDVRRATANQSWRPHIQYTDLLTPAQDLLLYFPALCSEMMASLRRQYHLLYQAADPSEGKPYHYMHYAETLHLIAQDILKVSSNSPYDPTGIEKALISHYAKRNQKGLTFATAPDERLLIDEPRPIDDITEARFTPNTIKQAMQTFAKFEPAGFTQKHIGNNIHQSTKSMQIDSGYYTIYLDPREKGYITFTIAENNTTKLRFKVHDHWQWTPEGIDHLISGVIRGTITEEQPVNKIFRKARKNYQKTNTLDYTWELVQTRNGVYRDPTNKYREYTAIPNIYSIQSIYESLYQALRRGVQQISRIQQFPVDQDALYDAIRDHLEGEKPNPTWGSSLYRIRKDSAGYTQIIEAEELTEKLDNWVVAITAILKPYGLKPMIHTYVPEDIYTLPTSITKDTAYAISVSPYQLLFDEANANAGKRGTPFAMYINDEPMVQKHAICNVKLRVTTGRLPFSKGNIIITMQKALDCLETDDKYIGSIEIADVSIDEKDSDGNPVTTT